MLNLDELYKKLRSHKDIRDKIGDIGDLLQYALPWFALLSIALTGNVHAVWLWIYAAALTTLMTQIGKVGFDYTWLGVRPDGGDKSFPSGHTSAAFSGAFIISAFWGPFWAIVPFLLAALTAFSRVITRAHYVRDVIAGALLAGVCVYGVFIYDDFYKISELF